MNRSHHMWRVATLTFAALGVTALTGTLFAGPLNPPAGAVGTSMKTLAEVEPRVAINLANTPGDTNSVYRITAPGSYYLTGNLQGAATKHGIEIATSGVTIDMGGFSLLGTATSLVGMKVEGARSNIAVSGGSASGWGGTGFDLTTATDARVSDVCAVANGGAGISVNSNAIVTGCSTRGNGDGIMAGTRSSVTNCTSSDDLGLGIRVDSGSTVRGCAVWGAGGTGISADIGCTVIGCTARSGSSHGIYVDDGAVVQNCSVTSNTGHGILSNRSATVLDCNSSFNLQDGVRVKDNSVVRGNTLAFNGLGAANAAGIAIIGSNNRVEGNNCSQNDRGIEVQAGGNFINRNTCRANGMNFAVVANNACYCVSATMSGAINGSNGGLAFGTSDPNANFSY